MRDIPPVYQAVIWEVRKAIISRGMTMEECDERSGVETGYTAKMLNPATYSGRVGGWDQISYLVQAVFGDSFKLRIHFEKDTMRSGARIALPEGRGWTAGRLSIRDFSRLAGYKGGVALAQKMKPEQRSRSARRAAKARWAAWRKARRGRVKR